MLPSSLHAPIIPPCSHHPSMLPSSLHAPVIPPCSHHPSMLPSSLHAPIIPPCSHHPSMLPSSLHAPIIPPCSHHPSMLPSSLHAPIIPPCSRHPCMLPSSLCYSHVCIRFKDLDREMATSYRFIHTKSIERPQLKFRDHVDNSNAPFIPLIRRKPNALKPLPDG